MHKLVLVVEVVLLNNYSIMLVFNVQIIVLNVTAQQNVRLAKKDTFYMLVNVIKK